MSKKNYLIIVSEDPFEMPTARRAGELALQLKRRGHDVALYLVQNGVLAGRAGARGSQVPRLTGAGVTVLADDFSLRERGIDPGELTHGVREAPIGRLLDLVMRAGTKTLWH